MSGLPRKAFRLAVAPLALLALGGCVSTLSSVPATDAAEGFRYALPLPVLQVTPQADGTMAVQVLYLPDPNSTYAVTASSFLGGYTMELKTKEGLLESVTFNPNSTAVAEQAIGAYGDIRKAEIDAAAAAETAAAAEVAEEAKAAQADAKALADAQTAYDVAVAKRDKLIELKNGGVAIGDALTAAELAIVEPQHKLFALQAAAAAKAASAAMNRAANDAANGQFDTAAGPIFYRLAPAKDRTGRVDLIADDVQVVAPTWKPPKPAPKAPDLAYTIVGPPVIRPARNGLVLKVKANQAVAQVVQADVTLRRVDAATPLAAPFVSIAVEEGSTYLYAVFDAPPPPGRYRLDIPVKPKADGAIVSPEAVTFVIGR